MQTNQHKEKKKNLLPIKNRDVSCLLLRKKTRREKEELELFLSLSLSRSLFSLDDARKKQKTWMSKESETKLIVRYCLFIKKQKRDTQIERRSLAPYYTDIYLFIAR